MRRFPPEKHARGLHRDSIATETGREHPGIAARLLRQADTVCIDEVLLCLNPTDGSNALTREHLFRGGEHLSLRAQGSLKCLAPMDIENMKSTTRLVKVDLAFLFQLADMTVSSETSAELQRKAFAAYQAAHKAVAVDYETKVLGTDS